MTHRAVLRLGAVRKEKILIKDLDNRYSVPYLVGCQRGAGEEDATMAGLSGLVKAEVFDAAGAGFSGRWQS